MLRFCRDLISLRHAEFGGQIGSYQALPAPPGGWAYQVGRLTVLANFSGRPLPCHDPGGPVLLSSTGAAPPAGPGIVLAPWQGIIARSADAGG